MVIHKIDTDIKGTSMDFRSDIKVLDCTVRDGSLINKAKFEDDFVTAVYKANIEAGVDYMEMGYKASHKVFCPTEFGPWKFSLEDDLRRIVGENPSDMKLSVMADTGRTETDDILSKDQSVIDLVRVACYIHQVPAALNLVKDAKDKGYETSLNLMAISKVPDRELAEGLEVIGKSVVDTIYLVDSFGSLFFQSTRDLALTYLEIAKANGKKIGIHAHNNQQLAFANTIEAMALGVSYLDATINGMGRGAGNCSLELLLGFLKNPKYSIRPILKVITEQFLPLRKKMKWGYDLPYMITGQLNEHPRDAIAFLDQEDTSDYLGFYESIADDY